MRILNWTIGPSKHCGFLRLHQSSEAVAQPRSPQPGNSPGLRDVMCYGDDGRIASRLGSSVRGHANIGVVVRTAEPVAHNLLELEAVFLALKVFFSPSEQRTSDRAADGTALADPHQEDLLSQVNSSVWHPNPLRDVYML